MQKYLKQIEDLYERNPGFPAVVTAIKNSKIRILNFSHHDLDGVTSAFILKRSLEKLLNAEVVTVMPSSFKLCEETLAETMKQKGDFDALIISDKGTFKDYDSLTKHIWPVIVIDHHQSEETPEKCLVFNPTVQGGGYASAASLLCHMISTKLKTADEFDDFAALIGCRGDFAFDPVKKTASEFALPFMEKIQKQFSNFLEVKTERPTMYDIVDRTKTALINQVGEVLQAGTLAHLYRDGTNGPELVLSFLLGLVDLKPDLGKVQTLEEFLKCAPEGAILERVFEQYRADWNSLEPRTAHPVYLGEGRGVGVYLIFARETEDMARVKFPAILPSLASTKLETYRQEGGHTGAAVIVFCPKEWGTHVSMRGGGGVFNCGKICWEIARRLRERYPEHRGISGGGHVEAAELVAEFPTPTYAVMHELLFAMEKFIQQTPGEVNERP